MSDTACYRDQRCATTLTTWWNTILAIGFEWGVALQHSEIVAYICTWADREAAKTRLRTSRTARCS